jgi:hypothetical protein
MRLYIIRPLLLYESLLMSKDIFYWEFCLTKRKNVPYRRIYTLNNAEDIGKQF